MAPDRTHDSNVPMFAILSIVNALVDAVYERRHDLGLETWHSPERTAERQRNGEALDAVTRRLR